MNQQLKWNDLLFENRNKDYGAYQLRKHYVDRMVIAFGVAICVIACLVAYPAIRSWFNEEEILKEKPKPIRYTELTAPPPIDPEIPPQQPLNVPPIKEAIKFLPPVVTPKEIVEQLPTVEELKDVLIANQTSEGPGEIIIDDPVEMPNEPTVDPNIVYTTVEQQPEFVGGFGAMMKFLSSNMKYPASARRMGIDGSVFVRFVVEPDGSISNVEILKGISGDCDKEAARVVGKMPNWKPGKQNGRAVRVRFVLPLKFVLG